VQERVMGVGVEGDIDQFYRCMLDVPGFQEMLKMLSGLCSDEKNIAIVAFELEEILDQ
jgi:hypothetical protein